MGGGREGCEGGRVDRCGGLCFLLASSGDGEGERDGGREGGL